MHQYVTSIPALPYDGTYGKNVINATLFYWYPIPKNHTLYQSKPIRNKDAKFLLEYFLQELAQCNSGKLERETFGFVTFKKNHNRFYCFIIREDLLKKALKAFKLEKMQPPHSTRRHKVKLRNIIFYQTIEEALNQSKTKCKKKFTKVNDEESSQCSPAKRVRSQEGESDDALLLSEDQTKLEENQQVKRGKLDESPPEESSNDSCYNRSSIFDNFCFSFFFFIKEN